jgi:hypothetical protein
VSVGLLASLPPTFSLFGRSVAIAPFSLQTWLTALRKPERMGVVGLLGLAVLAGVAFMLCVRRLGANRPGVTAPGSWLVLLFLGALYAQAHFGYGVPSSLQFDALPEAYPTSAAIAATSPIMKGIGAAVEGPLLELPATVGRSRRPHPAANAQAMYRAIFHRRPILNGYTGFWPPGFSERMERVSRLPDPEALDWLRRETGLALILVHADEFSRDARVACAMLAGAGAGNAKGRCREGIIDREEQRWLELADAGGRADLPLLMRDGSDLLFAVSGAPSS